jgi:uncharacterized protein
MANAEQKEPTMEEILASIRKIISDDDTSATRAAPQMIAPVRPAVSQPAHQDEAIFEVDEIFKSEPAEASGAPALPEPPSFEQMLVSTKVAAAAAPVVAAVAAPAQVTPPPPAPAMPARDLRPSPKLETPMTATPRYQQTILTEDAIAESAAGSLGKLIARMDISSERTLEGLVREMVKPMIKDWLDTHLPRIVEEKVEAEVQRIARMAR